MPDADDYTVGWICAVETEYVAARAFLDEIHPEPSFISRHDNNAYTLGKIGNHMVVMAVAPDGEYGTTSAAAVGRNMLLSFPNIRVGLMVGIGGGVPSAKNDIRLGDIVVSAPRNGYGGVLPYNYWDTIQTQSLRPLDHINQPPTLLRTAVNHLKAIYQAEGHGLEQSISHALSLKPRLQAKYGRPSPDSDRLFRSDYVHPTDPKLACGSYCASDPTRLVKRAPRGPHEDNPAIHFGLIASGNQLVKDATIRDRLSKERDILCFEMEAAGLMNHFPCLVVRGICDYSDSHKSKEWQGYAAMTAAAYTRDLLLNIAPTRVQDEKKLRDVVENIAVTVEDTKVNTERTIVHLDRDRENEIIDWLSPFDYASVQREHFSKSLAGTCQWFLDSINFHRWLDTIEKTFFCTGIPGAGKTILTSIVVNNLQERFRDEPTLGLAYVYCDYGRQQEQTLDHMFASILKQLAQRFSLHFGLPEAVRELYDQHLRTQGTTKSKVQPLLSEVLKCLPSVVELFSKVYIVVDALDEFQASGGRRSAFLKELLALQESTGINILATSRELPDIQNYFEDSLTCNIIAARGDVELYVDDQMSHMPDFVQNDAALQNKIQVTIEDKAVGMFSVAVAHLKTLAEQPTVGDLEFALQESPQDSYEIYRQSFQRINQKGQPYGKLAERVITYLHHSKRSVGALGVQFTVMSERGTFVMDEKFMPSVDMIISACEGLISYSSFNNRLSLVHHTLRTYLDDQAADRPKDVQSNAADKPAPKFNFGRPKDKSAGDAAPPFAASPFAANKLLDHVANSLGDARETGGEYRSAGFGIGKTDGFVKVDAKNNPTLDRNMSWLFVSRGSHRLSES